MTVTLQQLRYFLAVADVRSFTRAAELVGVAQPTLSRQLKALEDELGAPLVDRGARDGPSLTAAGQAVLPFARRILADADGGAGGGGGDRRAGARAGAGRRHPVAVQRRARRRAAGVPRAVPGHRAGAGRERVAAAGAVAGARRVGHRAGDRARVRGRPGAARRAAAAGAAVGGVRGVRASRRRRAGRWGCGSWPAGRSSCPGRATTCGSPRCGRSPTPGSRPRFAVQGGEMDAVLRMVEAGTGVAVVPDLVFAGRPGPAAHGAHPRALPDGRAGLAGRTCGRARPPGRSGPRC